MRGQLFPPSSVSLALSLPLPVLALGPMGGGDPTTEQRRTRVDPRISGAARVSRSGGF